MISKTAHAGAPSTRTLFQNAHLLHTHRVALYLSLPSLPHPPPLPSFCLSSHLPLQVALSVKGGGEGHVVEGARDAVGPAVGRHAGDAVLSLVRREFPPQLVGCDEVLGGRETRQECQMDGVQMFNSASTDEM